LTTTAVNGLGVSATAIAAAGALSISAGGTNQTLTLQGTGTGTVTIKNPSFNNANGATYSFDAADGSGVNTTICTMQGGCTGSMNNTGSQYTIPMFGATAYELSGSMLAQNAAGTILTVTGSTITGNGALSVTAGGSNQNLNLSGTGTGVVAVTGTLTATTGVDIAAGQVYKIGGVQIASTNLSDSSTLGRLGAANTWTAANTFNDTTTGTSISLGYITNLYTGSIATTDTSAASTNSGAISIKSGNASGTTSSSGNITIDSGTATSTTGSLLLGNTNTRNITLGNTTAATNVSIQGGSTGGINIGTANAATPITIGNITDAVSQVIKIGANATGSSTDTVTVGNLLSTSTTTIQGGTGASAVSVQTGAGGTVLVGTATAGTVTVGNASGTVTLNGTVNAVLGLSVAGTNVITSGRQLANLTIPSASTVLFGTAGAYGIPYVNSSNVLQFANVNGTYASTTKCLMSNGTNSLGFGSCPGSGGGGWSLTGNAGTTVGTNFIGTTDNQAVLIKSNSGAPSPSSIQINSSSNDSIGAITISGNGPGGSSGGGTNWFEVKQTGGNTFFGISGKNTDARVQVYLQPGSNVGVQGRVCSTLAAGGAGLATLGTCTNTGTDLAEAYRSTQSLEPGDIVAVDHNNYPNVVRSNQASQDDIVGIVSTDPNETMGTQTITDGYPIALNGRVPTKVNGEGGAIQPGDKITSSSVAGVGKKATGAGMIVGVALTGFDGNGQGTVQVFVSPGYYTPPTDTETLQAQTANFGDLNISGTATINNLTVTGLATVHDLVIGGHIITSGGQPTNEVQTAAGSSATVTVDGTDTLGTITITTGSAPTAGEMARIIFSELYTASPRVVLSPSNDEAAGMRYFKGTTTTSGFMLNFKDVPATNTTYTFDYFIGQ